MDAGVSEISAETLKAIYKGEITDWTGVPGYSGPSTEIQVVGRAEGSGTDTAFRNNLFGDPNAAIPGVDIRKGENQQVKQIVTNSENALAYMALAFVDDSVPAIALTFKGRSTCPVKISPRAAIRSRAICTVTPTTAPRRRRPRCSGCS